MLTQVNLNDFVFFTPTQKGLTVWKEHMDTALKGFEEPKPLSFYQEQVLPNGTVKMQLHRFMRIYGTLMSAHFDDYLSADFLVHTN